MLQLVTLLVHDYEPAIEFFTEVLGFELVQNAPSTTNDGRPKRWVVVRPPGGGTGVLLSRADGPEQSNAVGRQFAGRVGMFLSVDDLDTRLDRVRAHGGEVVRTPREEAYGRVAVVRDPWGNLWDLLE